MSSNAATPSFDWSKISLGTRIAGGGAIGVFCALWRIAFVGDPDVSGVDVSPSFGVFLALAGAIALLYGGYRRMQES